MRNDIFDIIRKQGLRLVMSAIATSFCANMYAQDVDDDTSDDEEVVGIKAPKRTLQEDRNTTVQISGVVTDDATNLPVAGVRVQALADNRYTAMTNAKGEFNVSVPDFCTSLYVSAIGYMAVQVPCTKDKLQIRLISNKFRNMYVDGTDYTAKATHQVLGDGCLVLDEDIRAGLGGHIRAITRSGVTDGGSAMFIRGLNSINANAQPLVIIDGVETDMQPKVTVLKNATALYGARGANGVILIETKRGHSMATRIDVGISAGVTMIPRTQTVMNASQWRDYATEMLGTVKELGMSEYRDVTFNFLNPGGRSGNAVKIEHVGVQNLVEVDITIITFDNLSLGLQSTDNGTDASQFLFIHFCSFVQQYDVAEFNLLDDQIFDILFTDVRACEQSTSFKFITHAQGIDHCCDAI